MKQLISAILTLLTFSGCGKIESEKQTSPLEIKRDTVTDNGNDDAFICVLPIPAEFPGEPLPGISF
jgi:protein TonB